VIDTAGLVPLLPGYLRRQRWFGAKDRIGEATLDIAAQQLVVDNWPALVRIVVAVGSERYQLLLGVGDRAPSGLDASLIGPVPWLGSAHHPGRGVANCYDGLADPSLALGLLRVIAPEYEAHTVEPLGAEQSNTSLVYDRALILKVFRRIAGSNPDVEVITALAARGFDNVAEPLAVWRADGDDLAFAQRFLDGRDGWRLALQAATSHLSDRGSLSTEPAFDVGGLAAMTARMHRALAEAFGGQPANGDTLADRFLTRAGDLEAMGVDVARVKRVFERTRQVRDAGSVIRIHGDYHLGQVMYAANKWFVLDFEGEPTRPVAERRSPASPIQDVAGMLRSLDYAQAVTLRDHPDASVTDRGNVQRWGTHARAEFVDTYRDQLGGSNLLPGPGDVAVILRAFELEKALYEVAYERAHRPDWVDIPMAAVSRLLEQPDDPA
jgi:maltokinase